MPNRLSDPIKAWVTERTLSRSEHERLEAAVSGQFNSAGYDDWGMSLSTLKATYGVTKWIYKDYFRVETTGLENVPQGRVLLIANHGGQIPIDGMLIGLSMLADAEPPRLVRSMVERWVPTLPFVSTLFTRLGQVVGDIKNCRDLLERDQCVLVFPEGVRGSGKTIFERYELKRFGTGFLRLSAETKTPIVPVAVIGCEEAIPSLSRLEPLAKAIGAPYLPLPVSGPLPLPTKVTLRFGAPIHVECDPNASDAVIETHVEQIRAALSSEISEGLKLRGSQIFTKAGK